MRLHEFADEEQLDELLGGLAKGIGAAAKTVGRAAGGAAKKVGKVAGQAYQLGRDARRGYQSYQGGNPLDTSQYKSAAGGALGNIQLPGYGQAGNQAGDQGDPAQNAMAAAQQAKQDLQAAIVAKEKELRDLKQQATRIR